MPPDWIDAQHWRTAIDEELRAARTEAWRKPDALRQSEAPTPPAKQTPVVVVKQRPRPAQRAQRPLEPKAPPGYVLVDVETARALADMYLTHPDYRRKTQ